MTLLFWSNKKRDNVTDAIEEPTSLIPGRLLLRSRSVRFFIFLSKIFIQPMGPGVGASNQPAAMILRRINATHRCFLDSIVYANAGALLLDMAVVA